MAQQMQQVQEYVKMLMQQVSELQNLKMFLTEMKTVSQGTSILFPMGAGIFFEGTVGDTSNVVMNVGAGTCVKKSLDEAITKIDSQLAEMEGVLAQMEGEFSKRSGEMAELAA